MADILKIPPAKRCERVVRDLNRTAVDVLQATAEIGGAEAFDRAARDLVLTVCGLLAAERGPDHVLALLDLVEAVTRQEAVIGESAADR
jgi:hypothetical protein